ncbi:hypothetical protein SCANM63S_03194 [Streptomyces canarius]
MNLAAALAECGDEVLLVDADLRGRSRPGWLGTTPGRPDASLLPDGEPPRGRRDRRAVRLLRRRRTGSPPRRVRRRPPAAAGSDSRTTVVVTRRSWRRRRPGPGPACDVACWSPGWAAPGGPTQAGARADRLLRRDPPRHRARRRPARTTPCRPGPPARAPSGGGDRPAGRGTPGAGRRSRSPAETAPEATAATPAAANSVAAAAGAGGGGWRVPATNAVFAFVFVGLITRALEKTRGAARAWPCSTILGNTCKLGADSGLVRLVSAEPRWAVAARWAAAARGRRYRPAVRPVRPAALPLAGAQGVAAGAPAAPARRPTRSPWSGSSGCSCPSPPSDWSARRRLRVMAPWCRSSAWSRSASRCCAC